MPEGVCECVCVCVCVCVCDMFHYTSLSSLTSYSPVVEGGRVLSEGDVHSITVPEEDPMGGARGAELQVEGV